MNLDETWFFIGMMIGILNTFIFFDFWMNVCERIDKWYQRKKSKQS